MIIQYRFTVSSLSEKMISSRYAYAVYAWLLEQISPQIGDALHQSEYSFISQSIWYDHTRNQNIWKINFLSKEVADLFSPILEKLTRIDLHAISLHLELSEKVQIESFDQLFRTAKIEHDDENRIKFCFLTPTAFKQRGKYTVLPSAELILNSLVNKWNDCFPETQIDDADAINIIKENLLIVDYKLKTSKFFLKGVRIPGFLGEMTIESRLPKPLENLWHMLALFSEYSGIGIKTTLGMGGAEIA